MLKLAFNRIRIPMGGAFRLVLCRGPVGCRRRERLPCNRHRNPDCVIDRPGRDFVVTDEPGEDRQTRGVGRGQVYGLCSLVVMSQIAVESAFQWPFLS
mgnify:CR=1 FL=1